MVSDDVILEQVEFIYDPAGNLIQTVTRQRYHNAPETQTGPLNSPSLAPKARVTYSTAYHDELGRTVATVEYGTNGGVALTRPATIPARSDTVLVTTVEYDSAGNVLRTTDPKGIVTRFEYDDLGRKVTVVEDDGGTERTTRATYTPDGLQTTLVAENADTGDQTTTYTYGTTLSDSDLATSTLLRTVAYPDSTGGGDTLKYSYNRQGELTTATDQRGCVHTYDRDKLARLIHDRVTTLGTGVDGAVRRLSASYDVRGRAHKLTSWNNASVNSGDVVNECFFVFNSFRQLIADYQSHSGAVHTSTSPKVQLAYADGSANTIRPMSLVYPDGRTLTYGYGTTDGINDACSRVASLIDDDGPNTHLADYSFLGLGATVVLDFTEPDVKYTLVDLSGTNDPDTGDIYSGLDLFGRVKDCRWYDYGGSADTARLKYGYDRASNRLWREDTVAVSLSKNFDELYAHDTLHRLADLQRGRLDGGHTSISSKTFAQNWTLDATGNWQGFGEAASGGSLTLDQTRDSNTVNEITGITNSVGSAWATPAHDPAGNMTTIPQPADPTKSFTATFDAWNRLVRLEEQLLTPLPILVKVSENQYDARTFRTVRKDYTLGVLATTRHCYYTPGWRCVEERLGSSPDSADPDRQFVWGNRYIDDLVCRDRDTDANGSLDERLYATQDANWNVVALTDTSGTVQERYAYSAYGMANVLDSGFVARASSSYGWETTYCGYRYDVNSGLLVVRFRFYHPLLGRWISRDPIGYTNGMSLYGAYFVPNGVDPFGLQPNTQVGDGERQGEDVFTNVDWGIPVYHKDLKLLIVDRPPGYSPPDDRECERAILMQMFREDKIRRIQIRSSERVRNIQMDNPNASRAGYTGFWTGIIPVYGSSANAAAALDEGRFGLAGWYSFLAVTDVFLVRSLSSAGGKLFYGATGSGHTMEIAVGQGAINVSPVHMAWRVGDDALHATGTKPLFYFANRPRLATRLLLRDPSKLFRLQTIGTEGALGYFDNIATGAVPGTIMRVPALNPSLAMHTKGSVWSCVTSTWNAWSRANYHVPNLLGGRWIGSKAFGEKDGCDDNN